jgi:prepilin-type N-terminal cleavage/methylation domain-containing protein
MITKFQKRKAFTLTELAIVLGVIGIIIGGVWYGAANVQENARLASAETEISTITQNMTSLMQGGYNPGYGAGTNITPQMITAKVIPSWATAPAPNNLTTGSHPWYPNMLMYWMSASPKTYRLSLYQVSMKGCVGLVNYAMSCTAGQPGCPIDVVVAVGAATFSLTTLSTATPMTTQIQNLCNNNNYNGGNNSVEFDYVN